MPTVKWGHPKPGSFRDYWFTQRFVSRLGAIVWMIRAVLRGECFLYEAGE